MSRDENIREFLRNQAKSDQLRSQFADALSTERGMDAVARLTDLMECHAHDLQEFFNRLADLPRDARALAFMSMRCGFCAAFESETAKDLGIGGTP